MFENVSSLGGEPGITFVQEITKHLFPLKDEIRRYFFINGNAQACTYNRNPFTAEPDDLPVELMNKKNSLICNALKVHRSLKILHWPSSR